MTTTSNVIETVPPEYRPQDYVVPARYVTPKALLPEDVDQATLVGRVHMPGMGPRVVTVRNGDVYDITDTFDCVGDVGETENPLKAVQNAKGVKIGTVEEILSNTSVAVRDDNKPYLLAPTDTQTIMAVGVTFIASLIGRLVEQRVRGNLSDEAGVTADVEAFLEEARQRIGVTSLLDIKPGSPDAYKLIEFLRDENQIPGDYLMAGYGVYAEGFPKALPFGARSALEPEAFRAEPDASTNPESEALILVNSRAQEWGAALSNENNDRKLESDSTLYVAFQKTTEGSEAVSAFIRIYDDKFTPEVVRQMEIHTEICDSTGKIIVPTISYSMTGFARVVSKVLLQMAKNTAHPDGFACSMGTGFSIKTPRDPENIGRGWFYKKGDVVHIWSKAVCGLANPQGPADQLPRRTDGIRAFADQRSARTVERIVEAMRAGGIPPNQIQAILAAAKAAPKLIL